MAETDPRPLKREDLEKFLPNQRAVRAFEKLFSLIPSSLNTQEAAINLVEELSLQIQIEAESGISIAQNLLSQLALLTEAVESLSVAGKQGQEEITQDIIPRVVIGSIAYQNEDYVDISGGFVTAWITDTSTRIITSSTTLTNGAGAAAATIANAPTAGNPTKWAAVDDNGTIRWCPLW